MNNELQYSNKANEVKIHQAVSMMPDQSDLYNHVSGKDYLNQDTPTLGAIAQYLIEQQLSDFSFSKLTLND
ncbi:hypothetical protein [Psychrobacillus sp. BM2]|uniref:hypothetical protein n=1 Tax=Psychrobacillus sp. BM2 TaxID=3400421 RepID=UPI003B02CDC0